VLLSEPFEFVRSLVMLAHKLLVCLLLPVMLSEPFYFVRCLLD
jgi:hypothetical protein